MEVAQKIPTPKQRKAAQKIIENMAVDNPKDLGVILADIGYSKGITETPSIVTNSVGFKQAVRDLGLTEELITNALVEDIKLKPQNRVQEIKLGAEILGMKSDEEKPQQKSGNIYNIFFSKDMQQRVGEFEEDIKERLKSKHAEET